MTGERRKTEIGQGGELRGLIDSVHLPLNRPFRRRIGEKVREISRKSERSWTTCRLAPTTALAASPLPSSRGRASKALAELVVYGRGIRFPSRSHASRGNARSAASRPFPTAIGGGLRRGQTRESGLRPGKEVGTRRSAALLNRWIDRAMPRLPRLQYPGSIYHVVTPP